MGAMFRSPLTAAILRTTRAAPLCIEHPGRLARMCGDPARPSSSYCPHHHSLCYILSGSNAEIKRLREVEALASAVGRPASPPGVRRPPGSFSKSLEQAVRDSS